MEPRFIVFIMMKLNNPNKLETIEKQLQQKGYDALNNPLGATSN